MDKIIINGGKRLCGNVKISGSKNAALPILIATLLTDGKCVIDNVPELEDINTVVALLKHLGKKIKKEKNKITITGNGKLRTDAPYELVSKMRASVLVAGPLLARFKKAEIPLPGGCAIGIRPINIHLDGLAKLGAKHFVAGGNVKLAANKLKGTQIVLDFPSVGATENLLMTATVISGKTIIKNAAVEPEITDLANFLIKMGANIKGIGTKTLEIKGVKKLTGCSEGYKIIADRIETGTFIVASSITSGDIKISNAIFEHNESLIEKIKLAGMKISMANKFLRVKGSKKIKPVDAATQVYPGFATDLQPLWMALMSIASGESIITETIFENRLQAGVEFIKMGADIKIKGNTAIVKGIKNLTGAKVVASDLRAAAALILAGLSAKGRTEITGLEYLDRGYENIVGKLKKLGADIKRVIDN
ncbi:MAG: UDP-N-acetylglucosamine 1-carboxyvinyltransferase [Elusimicrobia bacterium]|nr:UDP-N-acetylglucosamine 1-carboxyvinyltransferase [Elusimicrobiota bacterium]